MRYLPQLKLILLLTFGSWIISNTKAAANEHMNINIKNIRPANLYILINQRKVSGNYLLGIYAVEKDPIQPTIRRFKLWQEWNNDLKVYTESVNCSPSAPLRIHHRSKCIYLNRLNPGGRINNANKENHLVWWAACFPELAGEEPSDLVKTAKSMGFSSNLLESQEILVVPKS